MTVRSPHHHHHHQQLRRRQPLAHGASLELRLQFQVDPLLALLFLWSRLAFDCWPPRCTPSRQVRRVLTPTPAPAPAPAPAPTPAPHRRWQSVTLAAPGPGHLLYSLPRPSGCIVVVVAVVPRQAVEVTRQMGGQLCE
jgi:hypothetical protein